MWVEGQYSLVDLAHLSAHLCQCPREAPVGQEDLVAQAALVVLLGPDHPAQQIRQFNIIIWRYCGLHGAWRPCSV